jgi:hypothetical protein
MGRDQNSSTNDQQRLSSPQLRHHALAIARQAGFDSGSQRKVHDDIDDLDAGRILTIGPSDRIAVQIGHNSRNAPKSRRTPTGSKGPEAAVRLGPAKFQFPTSVGAGLAVSISLVS